MLKLIHCTLTIDENIKDASGRTGLHIRQALFAEEARLWWDDARGVGQGSSLVLSSVLFHSILDRSAPLSTNAIKSLRKSPMDLDVYAWLAHRLYHLSKPSTVTWQQLSEQFGHGYSELRFFRRPFAASIKRVLEVYPEAKLKLTDAGVILLPSRPHTARALEQGLSVTSVTPITCAIRARIANLSGIRAFASARIRPEQGTLHLSRQIAQPTVFKGILTNWRGQGRAPTRYICHAKPLHLSRPSVASVTQKRCISPAKCRFYQ